VNFVAERLVDVLNDKKTVLHTFPVALGASGAKKSDTKFEEKALSAAAHSQLVPTDELESLSARMHVSRSGTMTPYGDSHDVLIETNTGTAPTNSACVSERIGYGSRKDALRGRPTDITAGPAASKRFELFTRSESYLLRRAASALGAPG
jgi:hypothetical protein